jgi:hypothetical protein
MALSDKVLVERWPDLPHPAVQKITLWEDFVKTYPNTRIQYRYFCQLVHDHAVMRTIYTGLMDINIRDIPQVLTEQVIYKVNWMNTICADEKPFVLRKASPTSYYIGRTVGLGPIYKPVYKMLKAGPIYLLAAVSVRGLVLFVLSDAPFTTRTFNAFLLRVIHVLPHDGTRRFLLFDNASIHKLDEVVEEELAKYAIGVTHTPPSGCVFDPIEEFFAIVHQYFQRMYHRAVLAGHMIVLNREKVRGLIVDAVKLAGQRDLSKIFHRAGL